MFHFLSNVLEKLLSFSLFSILKLVLGVNLSGTLNYFRKKNLRFPLSFKYVFTLQCSSMVLLKYKFTREKKTQSKQNISVYVVSYS